MRILEGAAADLASKNSDRAASKFALLAYVQLFRGQRESAFAAAERALASSQTVRIRFLTARVFLGLVLLPEPEHCPLTSRPRSRPSLRRMPKSSRGLFLLKRKRSSGDQPLTAANGLFDTWIGHFDLGGPTWRPALHSSRFRVRPLHQTPWRGLDTLSGRKAHLRLLAARLLLPRSCPGNVENQWLCEKWSR